MVVDCLVCLDLCFLSLSTFHHRFWWCCSIEIVTAAVSSFSLSLVRSFRFDWIENRIKHFVIFRIGKHRQSCIVRERENLIFDRLFTVLLILFYVVYLLLLTFFTDLCSCFIFLFILLSWLWAVCLHTVRSRSQFDTSRLLLKTTHNRKNVTYTHTS